MPVMGALFSNDHLHVFDSISSVWYFVACFCMNAYFHHLYDYAIILCLHMLLLLIWLIASNILIEVPFWCSHLTKMSGIGPFMVTLSFYFPWLLMNQTIIWFFSFSVMQFLSRNGIECNDLEELFIKDQSLSNESKYFCFGLFTFHLKNFNINFAPPTFLRCGQDCWVRSELSP
jgi:hypothetical protein